MVLCAVYDKVAMRFGAPVMHVNNEVAIREFSQACKLNKNLPTADLSLQQIGDYNEETGVITPINPVILINGKEYVDEGE